MKRNLLLLAVMLLFGLYSVAMGDQDPNDNGVADTLYLKCCPGDLGTMSMPHFAKVGMYVTHDVPDPAIDSIAAFVIPLCYTATPVGGGVVNYCSLTAWWNTTDLYPFPNLHRSIFRHIDCNGDDTTNWMMDLSEYLMGYDWDTRILDLDGTSHFWLALFPTGSPDQRFGPGSRVLLATMTFRMDYEDTLELCIDSCFWPPASRLAFSRSDAVTYIPQIWDDYIPADEYCCEYFEIPNIPPEFTVCPTGPNIHYQNEPGSGAFTAFDADGQVVSVSGAFVGGGVGNVQVSYDPPGVPAQTVTGTVTYDVTDHCQAGGAITLTCTDNLGATNMSWIPPKPCAKDIDLRNHPPVIEPVPPVEGPLCFDPVCSPPIVVTDPDGDAVHWEINNVQPPPDGFFDIIGDEVCFFGTCLDVCIDYVVTICAYDFCGAQTDMDIVFHIFNDPPVITLNPPYQSVSRGDLFADAFAGFDPEGHPLTWTVVFVSGPAGPPVNAAYIVGNTVMWQTDMADALGEYTFKMVATDPCGLFDECPFTINLVFKQDYVEIDNYDCANPGEYVSLPVYLINPTVCFGGFELEFEFDYTALCFVDADPGDCMDMEGFFDQDDVFWSWEYFTYRILPCPIPPCQKYKILVYGQAEIPNGYMNRGLCICPPIEECVLVYLNFVVMNNENLRGFKIPVCFEWEGTVVQGVVVEDWECTENTFSSCDGNTLYTSSLLCEFNPDVCDDPGGAIVPLMTFQFPFCGQNCGGVDVCPAGPETCKRGDVNMNTVTYEVADAVLFANYFVYGYPVFIHDLAYQICATDVNADGRALTLSDLIYLIRVILHDAVEIPKLAPASEVANVIVYNNTITTECAAPIAAILFEFDGAVVPTLLADMEMVYNDNQVLVWSRDGNSFTTAEILTFTGDAELVSVTAVDYDTRELQTSITAKVAPAAFALHAAYPNPFNPFTNLSFTLPEAMGYSMKIYNVAGQLVRSYESVGSAGLNVIRWDGKDAAGVEVSSGVYFYKLIAGSFSATHKMVMMK